MTGDGERGGGRGGRILVSACLLGERVRYDGGHRSDPFVTGELAGLAGLVPVCPETGCGLPVPREPMELRGDPAAPRLVGVTSGTDRTGALLRWVEGALESLAPLEIRGFVCKSGSPSCALAGVPVRPEGEEGREGATSTGLFTGAFVRRFPGAAVADEAELADPSKRRRFLRALR